jgi:hypothetical protein
MRMRRFVVPARVTIAAALGVVVLATAAPLFAGFAGTDSFLPAVGRRPGDAGSQWYTLLWIHNPSATTANVSINFLERNVPNPSPLVFLDSIPPGDTRRYPNTVGTLFGVEKWGALRITANVPVLTSCRMYNLPPGGEDRDTQGQAYNAIPASFAIANGQSAKVLGVNQTTPRNEGQFRYSFGWVETTGSTADVRVIAYDETGVVIADKTYPTTGGYEPRYYPIEDLVPSINTSDVTLEMRVVGGAGRIVVVGSGVANHSNDATTFEMGFRDELLSGPGGPYVRTLNGLSDDVTLAAGANIAITPSGNALTIAMTGVPGGTLPAGTSGQTLYSNGSGWLASSVLTNDGAANVGINGALVLPNTTSSSSGVITFGESRFIHNYAGQGAGGGNTFVGKEAGNFTMGGPGVEGSYNTGVGHQSLSSNSTGYRNTASGGQSLFFNTTGYHNTASGGESLFFNTAGYGNTANGNYSLYNNTLGSGNTANGFYSLSFNLTGNFNIAIGSHAGSNLTTGSYNIDIGNPGMADEGNTIRIGEFRQTRTFIAGIYGVTTGVSPATAVVIDSNGQLGTVSSSIRFKQDVGDMGEASSPLMKLRPVMFRYTSHPDGPLHYGLIAEEVEQVMPELVVRDATGQPETVAYHELPALLLNELQKQRATIEVQQAEIEALKSALADRDRSLERRLVALEQSKR